MTFAIALTRLWNTGRGLAGRRKRLGHRPRLAAQHQHGAAAAAARGIPPEHPAQAQVRCAPCPVETFLSWVALVCVNDFCTPGLLLHVPVMVLLDSIHSIQSISCLAMPQVA